MCDFCKYHTELCNKYDVLHLKFRAEKFTVHVKKECCQFSGKK